MIAKIAFLFAAFAAAQATLIGPGLLNAGLLSPLALSTGQVVVIPGAVSTDSRTLGSAITTSQVVIPGAVTSDKRVIGTMGLIGNGLIGNGLVGNGLIGNGLIGNGVVANSLLANGLIGNGLINKGLVAPLPLLAAPGLVKTLL